MEQLFLFDIDGTLADTQSIEDPCFFQALEEVHGIVLKNEDWSTWPHVSDWGIVRELLRRLGRESEEFAFMSAFRARFAELVREAVGRTDISVPGVAELPERFRREGRAFALATGGWGISARIKLGGIPGGEAWLKAPMASSDDHYDRREIMKIALKRAEIHYGRPFREVCYFGDGAWDVSAARDLRMGFVGLDLHANGKLKKLGVARVLRDFRELA